MMNAEIIEEAEVEIIKVPKRNGRPPWPSHIPKKVPRKKMAKKKWPKGWMRIYTRQKYEDVINAIVYWLKETKHKRLYKPYTPLSIRDACTEFWLKSVESFFSALKRDEALSDMYNSLKETKREIIRAKAVDNIDEAISWKKDIDDIDLANLSLKFLERTDKAYNPRIEIEQNIKKINIDVPIEELTARLYELMNR